MASVPVGRDPPLSDGRGTQSGALLCEQKLRLPAFVADMPSSSLKAVPKKALQANGPGIRRRCEVPLHAAEHTAMRAATCLTGTGKQGVVRRGRDTRKTPGEGEEGEKAKEQKGEEGERGQETEREREGDTERKGGRNTEREGVGDYPGLWDGGCELKASHCSTVHTAHFFCSVEEGSNPGGDRDSPNNPKPPL